MSEPSGGVDLAGIGKIAEAVPKEGWQKAIDTACNTFSDLIAPITKTTVGLGALIQSKFDSMADVQKVFAADAVRRAREKCERGNKTLNHKPSARVLIAAIEQSSVESENSLREIWSNLIANELTSGNIHPDFPNILSRLSARDALTLATLAENHKKRSMALASNNLKYLIRESITITSYSVFGVDMNLRSGSHSTTPSHEHLVRLGLIENTNNIWIITKFGEEFVRAVTDSE